MGIRGQYTRQTDTRVSSGRKMEAFFAGRDRRGGTAYLTDLALYRRCGHGAPRPGTACGLNIGLGLRMPRV